MLVSDSLTRTSLPRPCAITIGSYDGVHRGHQKILRRMRGLVGPEGSVVVITFKTHPSHVLPHRDPVKLLFSNEKKAQLLEEYGVDALFLLDFTPELSNLSYQEFFEMVMECFPFDFLVLGKGDSFGKNREGTEERLMALGKTTGVTVEVVEKVKERDVVISSGKIRQLLQEGNLEAADHFLGHSKKF